MIKGWTCVGMTIAYISLRNASMSIFIGKAASTITAYSRIAFLQYKYFQITKIMMW